MQGLADGYFVLPYTIGDYLAGEIRTGPIPTVSKEFDIGNAMLVQLRFFKDEWKHEVSLTPNSDEGSFTVAQLAQLRGDKLPLHIYIRRGTGISRAKIVTDKDNDTLN